jgi:hypothetical protein
MRRFTETTKWREMWFRKLSCAQKMLWLYLQDCCDHAGIFEFCPELFTAEIGSKVTQQDLAALSEHVKQIGEYRYIIVSFIPFQYKKLSRDCRAHGVVYTALERCGLTEDSARELSVDTQSSKVAIGYPIPYLDNADTQLYMDKDKDKDKDSAGARKPKARGSQDEVMDFCKELSLYPRDAEWLFHKFEGNGWTNGGKPIKDWKATARAWKAGCFFPSQKNPLDSDCWPQVASEHDVGYSEAGTIVGGIRFNERGEPLDEDGSVDLALKLKMNFEKAEAQRRLEEGDPAPVCEDDGGELF